MSELGSVRFIFNDIPECKAGSEWLEENNNKELQGGVWAGELFVWKERGKAVWEKECYFGSCCKDLWENRACLTVLLES